MKAIFDIILVLIMLSVMIMLLMGVNQLADNSHEPLEEENEIFNKEYHCKNNQLNKRGILASLLIRKTSANEKDR